MAEVLLEDQKRCLFENKLEELLKTSKGRLPVALDMVKAILQQLQLETREEKSILETNLAQTEVEKERLDWARTVVKQELKSVENDWNRYGNYINSPAYTDIFRNSTWDSLKDCGYGALRLRKKQLQETMNNLNDVYRILWTDIQLIKSHLGKLINEEIARVQRIHTLEVFQSMPHLFEGHNIFSSLLQELEKLPAQMSVPNCRLKPDLIKHEPRNVLNTERMGCTFQFVLRHHCNKGGSLEVYNDMIDAFKKELPKLSVDLPSSDCEKFLADILKGHTCRIQRERIVYSLLSNNLTNESFSKPDHLVPEPEDDGNMAIRNEENRKISSPNWCKEMNKVDPSVLCVRVNLDNESVCRPNRELLQKTCSNTDQLCPENMDCLSPSASVDCQIKDAVNSQEENCKNPKNESTANITSSTKSAITKNSKLAKISKANKEKKSKEKERVRIIELNKLRAKSTDNRRPKKTEPAECSATFKETIKEKEIQVDEFKEKVEFNINNENPVLSKKNIKELEQRSNELEALMAEFRSQLGLLDKSEHTEHSTALKETNKEEERDEFTEKVEKNVNNEVSKNPVLSKKKIKKLEQRSDKLEALMAEFQSQLLDLRRENRQIIEKLDQTHEKLSEQKNVGEEVVTYGCKEICKQDLDGKMQGFDESEHKKVGEEVVTYGCKEICKQDLEGKMQGFDESDHKKVGEEVVTYGCKEICKQDLEGEMQGFDESDHKNVGEEVFTYGFTEISKQDLEGKMQGFYDSYPKKVGEKVNKSSFSEMLDQCCEAAMQGSLVSDVPQQQSTTDELKRERNRVPGVCDYKAKNFEECEKLRAPAEVFGDVSPCLDSLHTSAPVDSTTTDLATTREAEELWLRHLLRVALDHECRRCCSNSSASYSDSDSKSE